MSLSTDVLSRATPTRLVCRGGRWVLELTRLEAVDRDVFQPRVQRLEGPDTILAVLRRSEEGQLLASGAAQLMRAGRNDEDRAFEANEGDWVPSSDGLTPMRHGQPQPQSAEASDTTLALAELRAELAVLRASHSRLRDRVVALEAVQSGVGLPNGRGALRGGRGRRRSEPPPVLSQAENPVAPFAENAGFAATQASPALGATSLPSSARGAAPTPPHLASIEDMARALGADERPPVLGLPSLHALNECLQTLMEQAPKLTASASELPLGSMTKPQSCKLLDDDGRERGMIVLDLAAGVLLGAALLALSGDEAQRQVRDQEPSEDALLAASEICNNLTGPVNAVPGNQHVRSTALVSVDVGALPKPRARLDLAIEGGSVVFAMF